MLNEKVMNLVRKLPDSIYLRIKYFYIFKKPLNLNSPRTFNEKLQWLKLNNKIDFYTTCVDKLAVKEYICNILGEGYTIPTLAVYSTVDEIDFDQLPSQFVLKTTHDSGGIVICQNKEFFDIDNAKEKLNKSLQRDFHILGREWPYTNVKRRIIAEQYMVDESGSELKDYKVFCFNGVPKFIQLDYGRFNEHHRNLYDIKWNIIPVEYSYKQDKTISFEKPQVLNDMLVFAEKLSKGIPFVRIDFYIIQDKIYFGEMTFFPESGFGKFIPNSYDRKIGDYLEIGKY